MTEDEEIDEWLDRMDFSFEETQDIELFKVALASQLKDGIATEAQIEATWAGTQRGQDYSEHGVQAVVVDYTWGREVRYGIQGLSGLWGYDSLQQIREGEGW